MPTAGTSQIRIVRGGVRGGWALLSSEVGKHQNNHKDVNEGREHIANDLANPLRPSVSFIEILHWVLLTSSRQYAAVCAKPLDRKTLPNNPKARDGYDTGGITSPPNRIVSPYPTETVSYRIRIVSPYPTFGG